ncbi:MAG: acetyl-CoA C-acyltransferase [Bacillati bacterium ANGP1]|uniref:acetyl-CoA C-acyltransferase n=1 Tax=Candidatus Segetimicrobium genomatis TaxID=2569760 RepID=A0A537K3N9_9BACT|nr:MAG: acetyl-CoA C-acyltransferase [Terrabacteria group bacterium ANGP1]
MRDAVILDAIRTPIGRYAGALRNVRPDDLAAHVVQAIVRRGGLDPATIEDVILGCANQAGEDNRNIARMAVLLAGLPPDVPGQTVNRLCGSGMQAVHAAAQAIAAGLGDVYIAGGVESMTRAPYVMGSPEDAFPRGPIVLQDTTIGWRFPNPRLAETYPLYSMGETAENVAERYGISREDQDAYALESQQRAAAAMGAGRFAEEIVPVTIPRPRGAPAVVETDEHPRPDTTLERLAALRPAFRPGGTVTAGNSSGINDGAAALLVASAEWAEREGRRPIARIAAAGIAGVDPSYMGIGPVPATRKALARAGKRIDEMEVIELNEAFASQVLACVRDLGIDRSRLNPNGGAIALGHPIGASGARILVTLLHEMRRSSARWGLATMCIGVGQGIATIVDAG